MLMRVSCHWIEVHLARMVIPRSFSRSLESITRSATMLVDAEGAGLAQELVNQGRLAVVDMGDDGDVAQFHDVTFQNIAVTPIIPWRLLQSPSAATSPNPLAAPAVGGNYCGMATS